MVFLRFGGDSGNKVFHHFHTNSKEMMSTKKARRSIMVQLLTKIEAKIRNSENECKFTKSGEKPAKTPNTKSRVTPTKSQLTPKVTK